MATRQSGSGDGPDPVEPHIRLPIKGTEGVPYLSPELQLLYKSKGPRPKDDVDAAEVTPALDDRQRDLLSRLLEPDHAWQRLLT